MNALIQLSPATLRRAADIQERIFDLQRQLADLLGQTEGTAIVVAPQGRQRKRKLSAAGLAAIRAGVRRRMARYHRPNGSIILPRRRRRVSAAISRARSQALKARWAARKAAGKLSL